MSGGQGYRHGHQGNEHMYDKIDIKLTAHLFLIALTNGYGNKTVRVVTIIVLIMLMKVMMQAMTEYNP